MCSEIEASLVYIASQFQAPGLHSEGNQALTLTKTLYFHLYLYMVCMHTQVHAIMHTCMSVHKDQQ